MKWRGRMGERGAEIVEFAIAAPVMLLLMAGIVDFALFFQSYEVTTNAAREGARLAVLPGYTFNDYAAARQRVTDYIRTGGAKGSFTTAIAPEPLPLGGLPGTGVRVTVTYTHDFLVIGPVIGLISRSFMSSLTYSTSAVMRQEIQPPPPAP